MLLVQLHAAAMTLMMLNSCLCLLLDVPAWSKIGRPLVRRQHERRLSQMHILYYLVLQQDAAADIVIWIL